MVSQGQDIIVGNVGDSRAVLATRDKDNYLMAVQLTVDLKPNLPSLSLSLFLILYITPRSYNVIVSFFFFF